ncbi:MAG: hypothetical protein K0S47_4074 [Herbinix sp.]|jgi:hypothetical protein|nr:hypothetical protein [Herbinix sp.]
MEYEKLMETIHYNGATFEVVERPEILWVGKIAYATNLTDEPDIGNLLRVYQELVPTPKLARIAPDWDAAISIDYWRDGHAPRGMMFAQETSDEKQADCYDIYKMPGSLFMRILNNEDAAKLLGKEQCENWELFGLMKNTIMPSFGYKFNENGAQEIEYHNYKTNIFYAYVPVTKM